MRKSQVVEVTLSAEVHDLMRQKVAAGEYENESAVIDASLRALFQNEHVDRDMEHAIAINYDEFMANPTKTYSIEEVRATLDA